MVIICNKTPFYWKWTSQRIKVEESIQHEWVKEESEVLIMSNLYLKHGAILTAFTTIYAYTGEIFF